jgi:hypothetical protein
MAAWYSRSKAGELDMIRRTSAVAACCSDRRNPAKLAAKLANRIRNLGYHVEISAAA